MNRSHNSFLLQQINTRIDRLADRHDNFLCPVDALRGIYESRQNIVDIDLYLLDKLHLEDHIFVICSASCFCGRNRCRARYTHRGNPVCRVQSESRVRQSHRMSIGYSVVSESHRTTARSSFCSARRRSVLRRGISPVILRLTLHNRESFPVVLCITVVILIEGFEQHDAAASLSPNRARLSFVAVSSWRKHTMLPNVLMEFRMRFVRE